MSLYLSKRYEWVVQSEIRKMSLECDKIGGINLSQGICDTEVPLVVQRGAQEAIERGYNTYTRYDGLAELRKAIADKQKRFTGMEIDPDNEIVVSAGSTGALFCACFALLNPGDEIILFEPYYGYHLSTLIASQAVPVYVRTNPPDWSFTLDDLKRVVSPRLRGIIVNTPANPSGKVFSHHELDIISQFAAENDLFVFTDEIYEHFIFDGRKHIPPALMPGMNERTITISGLSKTFSITGWRIGYCICHDQWTKAIGYFNDLFYVCAPAPLQMGVAEGLNELNSDYYSYLASTYQKKRDMICTALAKAELKPYVPEGAYYVLADISKIQGKTSKDKAMWLLNKTGIACVPGDAFYHDDSGEFLARFCFAKEDKILEEAIQRLRQLK